MLRILRDKKAQNTMEYALLIALVVGVFSAMQIYVRRGLQARLKGGVDSLPDVVLSQSGNETSGIFGNLTQYEPYYTREGAYNITTVSSEGVERGALTEEGGMRELGNATTSRSGTQQITGSKEDIIE